MGEKGIGSVTEEQVATEQDEASDLPEWMHGAVVTSIVRKRELTMTATAVYRVGEYLYQYRCEKTKKLYTAWYIIGKDVYRAEFTWGSRMYRFEFDLNGDWQLERSRDDDDTAPQPFNEVAYGVLAKHARHISYAPEARGDSEVEDLVTLLLGELLQKVNIN